jgi:hypothetical protein
MGKYDITGALSPVQSTFVDPGLATFKEAALLHRKNYDANKDAYNLTKRVVGQMQLMPGDEDSGLRDEFAGIIDQSFEQIIESGAYEDADMAVQNAVSFITSDKTVLQAQQNAAEYLKEEALIDQYGPSGVLDFNKNARETFTTKGTDEEGNEITNSYRENMEMKEGYAEFMTNLVAGIAKDGSPWMSDRYGISADQLGQYLSYGNSSGVSQSKMERVVEDLYDTYIEDKVGDQDYRRLRDIHDMSDPEIKANIINRMKTIGQSQVGNVSTLSGLKDIDTSGGGQSPLSKGIISDPYTRFLLNKEKGRVDPATYGTMTGLGEGAVPNSFAISGQDNIMLEFATQMSDSKKKNIATELVNGGYAETVDEALSLLPSFLSFLVAEEGGKPEQAAMHAENLGFDYENYESKTTLQGASKWLKGQIDQATLDHMGGMLKLTDVSGFFIPNSGTSYNAEMIGGSLIVDGRYGFTEDQMNTMADQMGAGHVGAWFFGWDPSGDDIENQGIWETVVHNDVTYWTIAGKSAPITYNATWADKWAQETTGQATFDQNQEAIHIARDYAISMDQTNVIRRGKITKEIAKLNIPHVLKKQASDLGKEYLQIFMNSTIHSNSGNPVRDYSQASKAVQEIVKGAASEPGATKESINKALLEYYTLIFPGAGQ